MIRGLILFILFVMSTSAQTGTMIDWGQIRGPFPYVGGSDQQIQYSNMGVLAGSPNLSYNYTTGVFTLVGEGQFKNGIMVCGGTTCPPYDPYGISVAINTSFNPWAVDGVAGLGDTTIIDYIGIEGVFFRIKGYDVSNGGDYFDWTRGKADNTGVLPQHQIRLADSSGEDIQYYTGSTYPNGVNAFSGVLGFGLCHSVTVSCTGYAVDVGLSRTVGVTNTLEVNTTVPGALAQFKVLGLLVNQSNDSSGYQIQSNGGIEMTNASDNIISKGTSENAIATTAGGIDTATTFGFSGQAAFRYSASHVQFSNDGATWNNVGGGSGAGVTSITGTTNQVIASASTGAVTLSLPQSICPTCTNVQFGGLLINQSNDSSGYQIQSNGGIEMTNASDNIISKGTAENAIATTAGGIDSYSTFGFGGNVAFRYNSSHVQWSDNNGSSWTNISAASGGGTVTSVATSGPIMGGTFTTSGTITCCVAGSVANSYLANSSLTVTAGTGMTGGGSVSLGGSVTLNIGQAVATTSVPQFAGLTINQANDGSGYLLQALGGIEMASTAGSIYSKGTAYNAIQAPSGGVSASGFYVGSTNVIDTSGYYIGGQVNSTGIVSGTGFWISGTYQGQTWTVTPTGGFTIAGSGCTSTLVFRGGILVSCT